MTADRTRTIDQVGRLLIAKLAGKGRKKSHVEGVDSHVRVHLVPFFADTPISRIEPSDVERLMAALRLRDTRSLGLWSRRSRVRILSLTPQKSLQEAAFRRAKTSPSRSPNGLFMDQVALRKSRSGASATRRARRRATASS